MKDINKVKNLVKGDKLREACNCLLEMEIDEDAKNIVIGFLNQLSSCGIDYLKCLIGNAEYRQYRAEIAAKILMLLDFLN